MIAEIKLAHQHIRHKLNKLPKIAKVFLWAVPIVYFLTILTTLILYFSAMLYLFFYPNDQQLRVVQEFFKLPELLFSPGTVTGITVMLSFLPDRNGDGVPDGAEKQQGISTIGGMHMPFSTNLSIGGNGPPANANVPISGGKKGDI